MPSLPPRRGFTVLELIVVMGIIGITLGILVPRLRVSPRGAVEDAGIQLLQDVDVARTRAIAARAMVRLRFDAPAGSYTGYLDHDGDGTVGTTDAERLALQGSGTRVLPAEVRLGRGTAPPLCPHPRCNAQPADVSFTGLGLPIHSQAFLYLRSASDAAVVVAVEVMPSGGVRLWRHRAGAGWE